MMTSFVRGLQFKSDLQKDRARVWPSALQTTEPEPVCARL